LNNDHLLGSDCYPEDVPSMIALLNNRRGDHGGNKALERVQDGDDDASVGSVGSVGSGVVMSFLQSGRRCFCCGSKTHLSTTCPDKGKKPRSEWYLNKMKKGRQHFQSDHESSQEEDEDDQSVGDNANLVGWNM
jgi:hypothetical protein